tara:strand:+ start:196 stop:507 length:312 start_codon:yes stop_codon:yes gene_type:complete
MAKIKKSVIDALREEGKNLEIRRKKLKELENVYQKTMGFENQDTRSPKTKAAVSKSSTPKPSKLADSGFVNQGLQVKNLVRKFKGQKPKKYKTQAYKSLLKGT